MFLFVLGVCVLCAREEGAYWVRSGNSFQTPGVLQSILWNRLPPKKTGWLHAHTCTFQAITVHTIIYSPHPHPHFYTLLWSLSRLADLVAIPDFLAGAMENWGLITFRETSLLVGKQSSPLEKQVVAYIVAHELAHQVVFFAFDLFCEWNAEYDAGAKLFLMLCQSGLETW